MSEVPTRPAPARPAATVLLLRDDPFRVLMVTRAAKGTFASALVFPGGAVDADDAESHWLPRCEGAEGLSDEDRAFRIAALRETWEEVGLFVEAGGAAPPAGATPGATAFAGMIDAVKGRLALQHVVDFSHWITPEIAPRRFDTRFFLCAAPLDQVALGDDSEVFRPEWIEPSEALAMGMRGERSIMLPTRLNLQQLAQSNSIAEAFAEARTRYPLVRILPRVEETAEGRFMVIPQEAGYGQTHFGTPGGRPKG